MEPRRSYPRARLWILWLVGASAIGLGLAAEIAWTRPVRRSVEAYSTLIGAAKRQDLDRVRSLCSAGYLRTHSIEPARGGGVVGLPHAIHKNFRAWRQGPHVWLCPTNRVGPVYQFVLEGEGTWKFDGPVGWLRPGGVVEVGAEAAEVDGSG